MRRRGRANRELAVRAWNSSEEARGSRRRTILPRGRSLGAPALESARRSAQEPRFMETSTKKSVLGLYRHGSRHVVGDGFHVRNLFPSNPIGEDLSPFLLLDYAGPTRYEPT